MTSSANTPARSFRYDYFVTCLGSSAGKAQALCERLAADCSIFFHPWTGIARLDRDEVLQRQSESIATIVIIPDDPPNELFKQREFVHAAQMSRERPQRHWLVLLHSGGLPPWLDQVPTIAEFLDVETWTPSAIDRAAYALSGQAGQRRLDIPAIVARSGEVETSQATTPAEWMLDIPLEPMGERLDLRAIIRGYADAIGVGDAPKVIADVNSLMQSAYPDQELGPVRLSHLPAPDAAGVIDFWLRAFDEASRQGPRALAALLLAVPSEHLGNAAEVARIEVLELLRTPSSRIAPAAADTSSGWRAPDVYAPRANLSQYLRTTNRAGGSSETDMLRYWLWVHEESRETKQKAWEALRMSQRSARDAIDKRIVPDDLYDLVLARALSEDERPHPSVSEAKSSSDSPDTHQSTAALAVRREQAETRGPSAADKGVVAADWLDVSAFAPAEARRGDDVLVQIFLHRPGQSAAAAAQAKESDQEATRRGVATLEVAVAIGQRLTIVLAAAGAVIEPASQQLTWRGEPRACQFSLKVPEGLALKALMVVATVIVDDAAAGSLRFRLPLVDAAAAANPGIDMVGDSARRYTRAFLSYASPDRVEVLKHAQTLKAVHISFFQDLLSLEPGERWRRRLYKEIDGCDLFLLFWSRHARASQWVTRETDRALKRRGGSDDAPPDIIPIVLEGPPMPQPPDGWKEIHFNDWLRHVIAAEQASVAARRRAGNKRRNPSSGPLASRPLATRGRAERKRSA